MIKLRNIFILLISQVSILSYLISSYAEHNFDETQRLVIKLIFLFFWTFSYFLSFDYIKSINISKYYYRVLFLSLILTSLGIYIGKRPYDSIYVLLLNFTYLHILLFLSTKNIKYNICILRRIILLSILIYILFNYLNLSFNGNSLYTIGMIQFPLLLFGFIVVYIFNKKLDFSLCLVLFIYILTVAHGIMIEVDNNSLRLQFIPLGMVAIILMIYFLVAINLSKSLYFFIILCITSIFIIFFSEITSIFQFKNRLTSLLERFHIFLFMMEESFWFILPQGFGSSLKQFDLSNLSFIGARDLYPPHSGIAVLLYEFSIFGILYYIYAVSKMMKIALSTNDPDNELIQIQSFGEKNAPLLFYSSFSVKQLKLLNYLIVLTWIIHNLLYLKGVITADYFSDDGIIIYMILYILVYKSLKTNHIFKNSIKI